MHKTRLLTTVLAASLAVPSAWADAAKAGIESQGHPPSRFTVALQQQRRASLPFDDRRDFEEARRGFIAAPDFRRIQADDGTVAWNMGDYDFLLEDGAFDSIHPSLQRQAVLNMEYGLFEVVPGRIYQVRGFDLANMSIIRGETGWILLDVLTAKETARAALGLVNRQLGARPVVAVIYSHSHADHFGGVRGVIDQADVDSGRVQVIAPVGFMEHAVAENVYAGNAMLRRLYYQYGVLLPKGPRGHVDQAIGKTVANGNLGLIAPTVTIEGDAQEMTIDGVRIVFQNTPGTEAPAEMNAWFPQFRAFWAAENITGTIHNIYTLRGALVRDALLWSKKINEALYLFGGDAEVMFSAHNWPRWGNPRIQEVMRAQRDAYANLNNTVLHLANAGVTINEIHNHYRLPASLQRQWAAHSYHGSEQHNSRAVINRYLGYWDANPATLVPLSPRDSAPLYVEMMGGAAPILARGRELYDEGEYLLAQEILNKLVYAQPANRQAKDLLADVFEQLGFQQESASLRNSFLAGALELRSGIPAGKVPRTLRPDMVRALTTGMWLDYLGILVDSDKADGLSFRINFITPDNGETYVLEMSNATLTNIAGQLAETADATLTIRRSDLEPVMTRETTLQAQLAAGKATIRGNPGVLAQLMSTLTEFDPAFEILPGTRAAAAGPQGRSSPGPGGRSR